MLCFLSVICIVVMVYKYIIERITSTPKPIKGSVPRCSVPLSISIINPSINVVNNVIPQCHLTLVPPDVKDSNSIIPKRGHRGLDCLIFLLYLNEEGKCGGFQHLKN